MLAGLSAGAMCWFEGGVTKSSGRAGAVAGLGLLPGSLSVHLDGEPEPPPATSRRSPRARFPPGYAADDGVALLWEDRELTRVVGSKAGLHCIRVEADGVTEVPVEALSSRPSMMRAMDADVRELRSLRYRASAGR